MSTQSVVETSRPGVDYALYDADQHYYEAEDALTRHLDPRFRHSVKWIDIDGRRTMLVNDRLLTVVPSPPYDPVGVPGSLETYFRARERRGAPAPRHHRDAPAAARVPRSRGAPEGDGRAGHRAGVAPAEPRPGSRGDAARRPRRALRDLPRVQHVARRGLGLRP